MRKSFIFGIALVLVLAAGWTAFSGQDSQYLERMDNWAFESPRRPGAVFSSVIMYMKTANWCKMKAVRTITVPTATA